MSPLSDVQFSRFSETEAGKLFTFGSDGGLEVMLPMTDDERRDLELHLKEHFRLSLAVQVKAAHVLYRHGRADLLQIRFFVKKDRLVTNPFYWYLFGYMDISEMRYRAPVFFVPSAYVHEHAVPVVQGDRIRFEFAASMDLSSKDKWRAYACKPEEVALRAVKFLRAQDRRRLTAEHLLLAPAIRQPGTILVARAAR